MLASDWRVSFWAEAAVSIPRRATAPTATAAGILCGGATGRLHGLNAAVRVAGQVALHAGRLLT